MSYTRARAQQLCTPTELELIVAGLRDAIGTLTPAQLRAHARRARTQRDRQAALLKKQATAARTARGAGRGAPDANRRTQLKLALFEEALRRFETRLARLETAAPTRTGRGGTVSPKAAARRAPATPAQPKKSVARRATTTRTAKAAKPAEATKAAKPAKATKAAKPAKATKTSKPATATKSATPAKASKAAKAPKADAAVKRAPVPARSAKAPAAAVSAAGVPTGSKRASKGGTPVSPTVRTRGKAIGAHARSANARGQARRDGR